MVDLFRDPNALQGIMICPKLGENAKKEAK